ncbi:DNA phosphorothioation-dependent restriction protein DptF [Massilia sp. H6]|uniref:DNA phosphorothioation-dependent restriction protein DptF n=1 Tax=Massilia sp. H6 TaxID=2970464 RepID=UPI002166DC96|nr:DNA phosphorothioation-dependent restriction protein DptF [Massilia sp. H6]UVW30710.1 DNA phosphorothioation-dependent restriction protein DptF [Massilia sp. H6]
MTTITFRDALSVLSKSSPFSVKTLSTKAPDGFDALKEWLYIEQDIERDLRAQLAHAKPGDVLFLCGSSGDGKSEILTRVHHAYRDRVTFHLDATHSFQPNQSAIQALDQVFRRAVMDQKILVVGINIGMIGNYAQEGSPELAEVRDAMRAFLQNAEPPAPYYFFNFENYPKFKMDNGIPVAPFAKDIMRRLTNTSDANPFYAAFKHGELRHSEPRLYANFRLLMLGGVQDAIIANIAKARLAKDQFVTARGLLDLLHHLLTGPGYLFDNLFSGGDNELAARVADFDPALLRTRKLDQLVLRYELGLVEPERDAFLEEFTAWNIRLNSEQQPNAASLIRLFSTLQGEHVGNDYHRQFADEFADQVMIDYAAVWKMHAQFDGSSEARTALRRFYTSTLTAGIFRYANRNAAELGKDEILLGEYHGVKIASLADLRPDYTALQSLAPTTSIASFNVALRVGDEPLKPMPFNINLFGLLLRLNQGYRPNKYDKNSIVLLDELVEQIKALVKRGNRLKLYRQQQRISLRYEDGMIDTVGEM